MFKSNSNAQLHHQFWVMRIGRAVLKTSLLMLVVAAVVLVSVIGRAQEVGDRRSGGETTETKSTSRPASDAATITVNSLSDAVNGSDGLCTLREAIASANTDTPSGGAVNECVAGGGTDTINITLTGMITLTGGELTINSSMTINGPGAHSLTVSANNVSRVFVVNAGLTATLSALTVSGGRVGTSTPGGGVLNNGTLFLQNSIVSDNFGGSGGGIHSTGSLAVRNSTVSDNNAVTSGGGIFSSGTLDVINSTISGNSARGDGGGLEVSQTPQGAFITKTTITNNHSDSNNSTSGEGGGIHLSNGSINMISVIVAGNFKGSGSVARDDVFGAFSAASTFNLIGDGSGMTGLTNGANNNQIGSAADPINPQLGPLQFNGGTTATHALLTGSRAIDKGHAFGNPTDQRGLTRPIDDPAIGNAGEGTDIGAVELQASENLLVNSLADTDDGACDANCTLREAITIANASPTHNAIYFSVTGTIFRAGAQLTIDSDITINGSGARLLTVRGDSGSRVFQINPNRTASLYGLTISGGGSNFSGGGIRNLGTLAVGESIISYNTAPGGGGISNLGTLGITNSTVSGNGAKFFGGGGIESGSGSTLSTLFISNTTISGNAAKTQGGALIVSDVATLVNTTITDNHSNVGNGSNNEGGGISIVTSSQSNFTIHNSIVAGNFRGSGTSTRDDIGGAVDQRSSFNLLGVATQLTNGTNGNQVGTSANPFDPHLSPLQFNGGATPTHVLLFDSRAQDKGNSALTRDQRGLPRPIDIAAFPNAGNSSDIGAVEVTASQDLVVNSLADTNDSACTTNPGGCTLREAIAVANSNADFNLITFSSSGTGTITLTNGQLVIDSEVAINGPGSNSLTVSGNNASRVFLVENNRVVILSGLAITNGNASGGGGGILLDPGGFLTVSDCVVSNNRSAPGASGGGISNNSATLIINDSTISNNSATGDPNGNSGAGGGIASASATSAHTEIKNSTVSGNTSQNNINGGGGIFNSRTLFLINSTINANSADAIGGGIRNNGLDMVITNSTISGNSSKREGGGILDANGGMTLISSTVTNNRSNFDDSGGAGNASGGGIRSFGAATLHNSIVAGNFRGSGTNTRDDVSGTLNASSFNNFVGDGTRLSGLSNGTNDNQIGTSLSPINPRLNSLADNGGPTHTHALLPGSPALDAGNNNFEVGLTDQRGLGFPRPADGPDADTTQTVDIGAFEAYPSIEDITDKATLRNTPLSVNFNVGDATIGTNRIDISPGNLTLIPLSNISLSGTGGTRTLQITPAAGETGQTTFTLTVHGNNGQTMSDSFTLTVAPILLQFSTASIAANEGSHFATINVVRTGDASIPVTVDYSTSDGTANERADYTTALGTLRFAAGETSKVFDVLLTDDGRSEGAESFLLTLSNPTGGAGLGNISTATVALADNDASNSPTNPIDTTTVFVRMHYHDFLNREPDAGGIGFWSNEIDSCGANAGCREVKRINVSAAFFLSIEFQETGYLVYRIHKAAFGNLPGKPVPVQQRPFLRDTQQIGEGVQVGIGNWEAQLEQNKQTFAAEFVTRAQFVADYPAAMSAVKFVDTLNAHAGGPLSAQERDQLVADLASGAKTRAQVLRAVAEDGDLRTAEFRKAFVLMQYFGYLRRDPDATPDSDFGGFNFWLGKLNEFDGNFVRAEMVKAFITSGEYRQRFGL